MALSMFCDMLKCLKYLKKKHVIHNDIKPSNIMISNKGYKLIDFSIARYEPKDKIYKRQKGEKKRGYAPGTKAYKSIWSHYGINTTYKDDLEGLVYTFVSTQCTLPWLEKTNEEILEDKIRYAMEPGRLISNSIILEIYKSVVILDTFPKYDYYLSLL